MQENFLTYNLTYLMKELGITPCKLSKSTGVGQATLYKIKDGVITNPTIETIIPIARYFGFSIDELINVKITDITPNIKNLIPLIAIEEINSNATQWQVNGYVNTDFSDIEHKCCIKVSIDNCYFDKNSILIVDKKMLYESSDFVIAKNNSDNTISIKKVVSDGEFFLQSIILGLNNQIFSLNDYKILGVIVGCIKYFRPTRKE